MNKINNSNISVKAWQGEEKHWWIRESGLTCGLWVWGVSVGSEYDPYIYQFPNRQVTCWQSITDHVPHNFSSSYQQTPLPGPHQVFLYGRPTGSTLNHRSPSTPLWVSSQCSSPPQPYPIKLSNCLTRCSWRKPMVQNVTKSMMNKKADKTQRLILLIVPLRHMT